MIKQLHANIAGNKLIHAISVSTITVSLLIFGTFVLFFVNVSNWIEDWGQSLTMSIYLKEGVSKEVKEKIGARLKRLPGVEVVGFVSKEQAMADLVEALGAQSGLVEDLSSNPLPASFEVLFTHAKVPHLNPHKVKQELEKMEGVDEVQYSEQWLEKFHGFLSILRLAGLAVGGLLCTAILFIITNTIKLTIYSRRDEIEILKLVGATDWFVKCPFLMEGFIQGLFSGVLALAGLYGIYALLSLKTIEVFGLPVLEIVFLSQPWSVLIALAGVALGILGSFIALGRFFKS